MPDYSYEKSAALKGFKYVCGVDEAGSKGGGCPTLENCLAIKYQ